jgi:hypothetical protein
MIWSARAINDDWQAKAKTRRQIHSPRDEYLIMIDLNSENTP